MTEFHGNQTEASTSTELTGGAGFTYEDSVVGYYLTALLRAETAVGLTGTVIRVAVQQRSTGQPLDDVVVDAQDSGGECRLSLQVKRRLTISVAERNKDFRKIIADCLATRSSPTFRVGRDTYGFIVQTVAADSLRNLRRILELAEASTSAAEFAQRFEGQGATSKGQRDLRSKMQPLIAKSDEMEWDFYRHFVIPDLSGLEHGGALAAMIGSNLGEILAAGETSSGAALFAALCRSARIGAGAGKTWTRAVLLDDLAPEFRLRGVPAFADDLETISQLTSTALAEISDQIGMHHVDRSAEVDKAFALLEKHRFVNITGLPGCGKSAVLRNAAERLENVPVLFLKSDLLVSNDWQGFAVAKGLFLRNPVDLLVEIGSGGNSILFIDGIDRIPPTQRAIVKDLMRAMIEEPALTRWCILATSRNQGLEPFRSWVPAALYAESGIGELSIDAFDDNEANHLAGLVPSLRPLLFGSEGVRSIARRPFFAAILAGIGSDKFDADGTIAQSETDLINFWWERGGYDARKEALFMRQRSLLDLAQVGGASLGKFILTMLLKPESAPYLSELVEDGIIRSSDGNATYSFTHDIFFEWTFYRLLVALGDNWTDALKRARQPPLLGRVVGLLAQHALELGQAWDDGFLQLNDPTLRPQWRRAWTTGPTASNKFADSVDRFTATMEADDWTLLRSFLVWFQAEQTIPNPLVLTNFPFPLEGAERIRLADMTGWPSDLQTWSRVILWLISIKDRVSIRLLPVIFELFKVWQNQLLATPNAVSSTILTVSAQWLEEIDLLNYGEAGSLNRGRWKVLGGNALKTFESDLRQTILLAIRAYPAMSNAVLDRAIANKQLRRNAYGTIISLSSTISAVSPQKLADLARAELLETLPKDAIAEEEEKRRRTLEYRNNIQAKPAEERTERENRALNHISLSTFEGRHDYGLQDLAIGKHHPIYFPVSPLHEPFASLFKTSPGIARELVRNMGNHATACWRQILEISPRRFGTPIPLDLDFPWGRQRFWGNWNSYNWLDGHFIPQPLACAFMALAYWAHKELERDVPVDELIRDVVEGHQSWTVLSLAGALAIEACHVSSTVLPIAASQRLWKMDMARAAQVPMLDIDLLGLGSLNKLPSDKEAAMNYLKSRPSRHHYISRLAPLFALSTDADLREEFRKRLALFPAELPYNYVEERGNSDLEAELQEQAEQWVGSGDASNYRASPAPDGQRVMIRYESPTPISTERQQKVEETMVSHNEFELAGWAAKSLRNESLDSSNSLESCLAFVRTRDTSTLFDNLAPAGSGMTQSAVSGVAACVLLLGESLPENEAWALDVMRRVEAMREERDDRGGGNIPWHPAFHLIAVLRADLQKLERQEDAAARLFGLCVHPNSKVAQSALAALLGSHDVALAWNATVLASDLCHYHDPVIHRDGKRDYTDQRGADAAAVSRAKARLTDKMMAVPERLPELRTPSLRHRNSLFDEKEHQGREPDRTVSFNYNTAAEMLRALPVDLFCSSDTYKMPFLTYVKDLVTWTSARFRPEEESSPDQLRRRDRVLLNSWPSRLGELFSRICPYVDVDSMKSDYLSPFLQPDDENGLSVTSEFAECVVCRHVLDAHLINSHAIVLLHYCLDQLLDDPIFCRNRYRAGQMSGFDLSKMVRAILLLPFDQPAPGAARFANGEWADLPIVLPLVDRLVGEAGWTPYVMKTYLTLVERSGVSYPIDDFVVLMTRVLTELGDNADGWVGTTIPARIAGAIQVLADGSYPLEAERATALLRLLDMLIDLGDRRAAAIEESEVFRMTQTP